MAWYGAGQPNYRSPPRRCLSHQNLPMMSGNRPCKGVRALTRFTLRWGCSGHDAACSCINKSSLETGQHFVGSRIVLGP